MERGLAMRFTRRSVLGMMLASAAHAAGPPARERAIVLFSTEADPDLSLATLELRKLYLGFTVRHDGHLLRPIRNRSDETLDAVFLQYVVSMSEEIYERRLLELSLQQGRPRPIEVNSLDALVRAMAAPHGVSFAWHSDLARIPGAHLIRVLWRA